MKHYFKSFTASGAVLTATNHQLEIDDKVEFEGGDLPAGLVSHLTSNQKYYVVRDGYTEDTFGVSATKNGTVVTTADAGSGTITYRKIDHDRLAVSFDSNK